MVPTGNILLRGMSSLVTVTSKLELSVACGSGGSSTKALSVFLSTVVMAGDVHPVITGAIVSSADERDKKIKNK